MRRIFVLSLLLLSMVVPAFAQAPQKRILPNGLTVLVKENHAAPVAAVRFYVRTGSIYEGKYLGAGISHLFEHVLQEGTKTRNKEQINDESQALGGQANAYTTNDITAYHITTAAKFWDRALTNLSDSMMNATFPADEVKTQQGIIHHEMALGEDDPNRVLWMAFYKTAFLVHPVRFPVIGYQENFDRLTRQDILDYYDSHYTPNNTVLSIAGDVDADEVFKRAETLLGSWQRKAGGQPAIPDEPRQTAPRRVVVEKDVQNANIMMGWHTIPLQHPDLYALDALAGVLGGGETSRLTQELRDKQELVFGVSAFSLTPDYNAGIFAVNATLSPNKIPAFEKAVWQQINRIKTAGVSAAELKRTQRQIETGFVFDSDVAEQAERMAYDYMSTGNPEYSGQYVARINAVTPAQVQAMAMKYLLPQGTTVAIVEPESTTKPAPSAKPAEKSEVKAPQLITLSNGLKVLIRVNRTTPTVAISAIGLGGNSAEPADEAGLANITLDLLTRGTTKRSATEFNEVVDKLGGSFGTSSGYNAWNLSSLWLARDWRSGLSLAHEALTMPAFSDDELQREKKLVIAAIKQQQDDPDASASLLVRKEFFGAHPYGRSPLGTLETVPRITRADVVNNWKKTLDPHRTLLAVYGDIDEAQVLKTIKYLFDSMPTAAAALPSPAPIVPLKKFVSQTETKPDIAQTVIYIAYPGIDMNSKDRYALTVLDGALSGIYYPGGRLHKRLRDSQLVYGVHAFMLNSFLGGAFVVEAATTKDKRDEVRDILLEELQKIVDSPIGEDELARGKSMAIAAHAIGLQSNSSQAQDAITDELFGLGYRNGDVYEQQINAITIADVQRVAKKYLHRDQAAMAIVEPKQ